MYDAFGVEHVLDISHKPDEISLPPSLALLVMSDFTLLDAIILNKVPAILEVTPHTTRVAQLECRLFHVLRNLWLSLAISSQCFWEHKHWWTRLIKNHLHKRNKARILSQCRTTRRMPHRLGNWRILDKKPHRNCMLQDTRYNFHRKFRVLCNLLKASLSIERHRIPEIKLIENIQARSIRNSHVHVIKHRLAGSLAQDPHILQRILELLARQEEIPRILFILDRTIGLERHRRNILRFQLLGHLSSKLFNLVRETIQGRDFSLLLLDRAHRCCVLVLCRTVQFSAGT